MRSFTTRAITALAIPAWLIACSDSPTEPSCVVNSVTVTGAPTELQVNATAQLGATVDSDDCSPAPTVTWSTSSGSLATVSNTGLVAGVAAGEVTITASAGGKSGTATFDIELTPVASVRIVPDDIVIGVGAAHTLTAEALDAEDNVLPGRTATWTVTDGAGATISANGALTGVTAGETATVTASVEGVEADAEVHVVRSRLAYFWNSNETPGGGATPDAEYSYSSLGGALSVSSSGTGVYSASFPGFERAPFETEAYFVTAYGSPLGAFCRNGGWGDTNVDVECFLANGTPADMLFTVAHVSSASMTGRFAYAWNSSASASSDAHESYRYNPTGGNIHSTYNAAGSYTVRFAGLGRKTANDREAVIVNSYTDGSTCQPASWGSDAADLVVEVRCFRDTDGAAFDSRFVVLVVDGARAGAGLGFAHADQAATPTYTPANSAVRPTGTVNVTRNGVGDYTVSFTGLYRTGDLSETFLISATGSTAGRCSNGGWSYGDAPNEPTSVDVECATTAGVAADMPFSIVALQ